MINNQINMTFKRSSLHLIKLFCRVFYLLLFSFFIFSCDKEDGDSIQLAGEMQIDLYSMVENSNGRISKVLLSDVDAILLTIDNYEGSSTEYSLTEIDLYQIDGDFISQKISLPIGDYKIMEFLVIDSDHNIKYITPLEGSSQAQNVTAPLPILFSITADDITEIDMEILSTEELSLEDFGLVGFNLSEVNLFSFLVNVSERGNLETLLSTEIEITSDTYTFSKELQAIANNSLVIKDGFPTYNLTIEHEGYDKFDFTYSRDSLNYYASTPLIIELSLETSSPWTPGDDLVDSRDGQVYQTTKIGEQVWMAENLRATMYNDGSQIPKVTDGDIWNNLSTPGYCFKDNDSASVFEMHGVLYNWYAINQKNVCPSGWHVSTNDEWQELIDFVSNEGDLNFEAVALKDSIGWQTGTEGTNKYGLSIRQSGRRFDAAGIIMYENVGGYWSSTESNTSDAYVRHFEWYSSTVENNGTYKKVNGASVRCIKD